MSIVLLLLLLPLLSFSDIKLVAIIIISDIKLMVEECEGSV